MAYDLIKKHEGLRLEAYKCPAGVWTIGYGTTFYPNGKKVKCGDVCTEEQAEQYLNHYIENEINRYLDVDFPNLKPKQRDALQSLIYNWGWLGFRKSLLYTAIKKNNVAQICRQWDFGFKNDLKGIYKRRTEELYLFIKEI